MSPSSMTLPTMNTWDNMFQGQRPPSMGPPTTQSEYNTPYEGPNLAIQMSWKLVVFDRKLEETTPYNIVILIYMRKTQTTL